MPDIFSCPTCGGRPRSIPPLAALTCTDLGEWEVKHGLRLSLVNLYKEGLGNPAIPEKLKTRTKVEEGGYTGSSCPPITLVEICARGCSLVGRVGADQHLFDLFPSNFIDGRNLFRVTRDGSGIRKEHCSAPFENLSDEKENAYFADGVQDEILTGLSRVADLKVISRTSVIQYKTGAKRNLREIGAALGVAHVLEGTVQRAGGRVRVNAQLIDARTDSQLWAETLRSGCCRCVAIESELAGKIVAQLQAKISPSEKAAIEQKPTADLAAYDLYVRAKTLIATAVYNTPLQEGLSEAVRMLNQAIERDPAFALAYYQLAHAHDLIYFGGLDHTPARLAMADAAIQSLTRLLPNSGEAHLALAKHLYWGYHDYDHARKELSLAQKSLPNDPWAFVLAGYIDRRQGRWDESTKNLERASRARSAKPSRSPTISSSYNFLHRYADQVRALDRAIAVTPKEAVLRVSRAEVELDWHADTRPLLSSIEAMLAEDSREGN